MKQGMLKWYSALLGIAGLLAPTAGWAQQPAPSSTSPTPGGESPTGAEPPAAAGGERPMGAEPPAAGGESPMGAEPPAGGKSPAGAEPPAGGALAPGDSATPAAANSATQGPAGAAEQTAEPPASEIFGYFRMDYDNLGLAVWAGAAHPIGPISIASDIILFSAGVAELDVGPSFTFGPVSVTPMAGIVFDFINQVPAELVGPELFTIISLPPIYFESWFYPLFDSVFTEGAQNKLYTRDFILFYPIEELGFGPHIELTVDLNETTIPGPPGPGGEETTLTDDTGLSSLQVGGALGVKYGKNTNLLLYLGYETQEESQVPGGDKLVGRFTAVYNW